MNIFGKILSVKTILLALLLIGILSIESYSQKKEEVRISPKAAVDADSWFYKSYN